MFHPLPTPQEMSSWDRLAIKGYGIRGDILMENAARAAMNALEQAWGCLVGASIIIVAGPGNNGGDGFALARQLHNAGALVTLLHTKAKKSYRGEAHYHLELARKSGIELHYLPRFDCSKLCLPDIVIDALFGIGLAGELREDALSVVRFINELGANAFVLALDVPSGLSALTGLPMPEAVQADLTATFHAAKVGLALPHATEFTGVVNVYEIGIPKTVQNDEKPIHQLIGHKIMDLVPIPQPGMHKGSAGHVLVIGGSRGLTGAPHLAALGALKSGAGLVTIACPAGLEALVKAGSPDIMTLPLGSEDQWTAEMAKQIKGQIDRFDSLAIGPGLGRSPDTFKFLALLLEDLDLPCVLDADALFHLTSMPEKIPPSAVLTPHPGEMGRFMGKDAKTVQSDRFKAAHYLAKLTGVIVTLKGSATIIATPDGSSYLNSQSAPNLAVAGTGDVLTGVIARLLAQSISPLPAVCLGVYWHALAGKMLEQDFPGRGNLASQVADALPVALKEYLCALQTRS